MDTKNPVFAGQVFAEMLAGICHPEFYKNSDQEVILPNIPILILGIRDSFHPYFIPVIPCLLFKIISTVCVW